ncbi:unnamed protein product [Candidula unifasciata]|uniref:G-protein coupled receptors family 1 profile domain-containing protein n=1 Tax=Candidula unifasciata TaxID=100452 RepID=A0A8S3ZSZ1_9EUPU|nr:unnamed protein product [Candidula unifasciata]
MRSPVNFILTALAIADIMTMSPYTVMAMYLYILNKPECSEAHTEPWMYFVMFHNLFIIACHMMATWLTVSLAVFRYIFVCKHQHASTMCSMKRAQITVLIVFMVTIVSNTPYLFMYQVSIQNTTTTEFCYWVALSEFAYKHQMFINFVHWLYGVVIKILPCILLAYLSTLIVIAMQKAKKRRARLLNNISRVIDHDSSNEHNRTTMMLVAVVLSFIITEIPQGLVAWISAVDKYFYHNVYFHLGDIMDILVLINSAVNFILYCIMSKQFRDTFINVFFAKCLPRFLHRLKQHPNGGDYRMVNTETTNV